jgi:hypothetical protein
VDGLERIESIELFGSRVTLYSYIVILNDGTNDGCLARRMKAWLKEMKASQERMIDGHQERIEAHHERMMVSYLEEMKACLKKTEATAFEAKPKK